MKLRTATATRTSMKQDNSNNDNNNNNICMWEGKRGGEGETPEAVNPEQS